jgi:putative MATE family efflux protein
MTSAAPASPLLQGDPLATLIRLAAPNTLAMGASTAVSIAETAYIGRLGAAPLAAMALVFPMVMLVQMMSAGAMGGGVSSAISRALGAGDQARANEVARHALAIGAGAALLLTVFFLVLGEALFHLLGGRGETLAQAVTYAHIVFTGVFSIWALNMLASILRGAGAMTPPAVVSLATAGLQIALGGALAFGVGPFPKLGIAGVALAQVTAFTLGALALFIYIKAGRARVQLTLRGAPLRRDLLWDILSVGLPSLFSPLQSILTTLIFTAFIARLGTEALAGFGIGSRLEFMLLPIAFSIGVSSVPMVGAAIGAGDIARARRVAWSAAGLSGVLMGAFGIVIAIAPELWARFFTNDPAILAAASTYLRFAGPFFIFYGFGLTLYFAGQGAGRVTGPLLGATSRLAIVAIGGFILLQLGAPTWAFYALVGIAMLSMGIVAGTLTWLSRWQPRV